MNAIESASDPNCGLASLRDAATRAPGDFAVRLALAEAELAAGDAVAAELYCDPSSVPAFAELLS